MTVSPSAVSASAFQAWRAATLAPFRVRIFGAIWFATLFSSFGSLIQAVGASWLMISIAPTPDMVALVQASTALPIMLLSLAAGAIADIWDRRRLMLIAQSGMFVVSIGLAVTTYLGLVTPWMLLTFTFLLGCGTALYGPAWQSSVGEQVPRELVPAAVAINSLGFNVARTVGPAIGGVIVASLGSYAAFIVNAVSYLGLLAVLSSWKRPHVANPLPSESLWVAMGAGLRYVRLSPAILAVLVRGLVFGLLGSSLWALMPLIARDLVGGGPLTYGLLLGAFGVGAVLGALVAAPLRKRYSSEAIVRAATIAFGLGTIGAAQSPWLLLTMTALLAAGGAWVLTLSTFNTSVQISSPRWVVGRSIAVYQMLTFGGLAIGSWLWGEIAHVASLPLSLSISGAIMVVSCVLGWRLRLAETEKLDLNPSRSGLMQTPQIDIVPRSGPIVVMVEYRIDAADRAAFADAMTEIRRIRRRDGARGWTLLQDMDEPTVWFERFHSPTWIEHQRRRLRHTMADRLAEQRVRAYHRGEGPPKLHLYLERPPTALAALRKTDAERMNERAVIMDPHFPGSGSSPPEKG